MVSVAYFSDGRSASHADLSYFAGRKSYLCVISFLRHQLCAVSCGSRELRALTRLKLDIVDDGTNRNVRDRKRVADYDIGIRSGYDLLSYNQFVRRDDVSLFAVRVNDQRDVCASVRVVFDGSYGSRNTVLRSLEVDDSIFRSGTAALMSYGNLTSVVSSCVFLKSYSQGFFRRAGCDFFKCRNCHTSQTRSCRIIFSNSHCSFASYYSPWKNSISLLFGVRVTIAFLYAAVLPTFLPILFTLPS